MSQATRPNDRHIIWSNQNLDVDDWREDYKEFLEANELDDDPNDEQALYEWMEETNYDYLSDERVNLNVQLSQPIIVIGDIGRWNGRVMGYKDIPSGNIRDCLYADTDYTEWYHRHRAYRSGHRPFPNGLVQRSRSGRHRALLQEPDGNVDIRGMSEPAS